MATISITPVPYRRITGLDPDALWALDRAAGGLECLSKFEDRTLLPFLLELRDKAAISAFLALPVRPEGEVRARHGVLRVWTGGPEDSQPPLPEVGIPFLAFAEPGWFDWLATDEDPRLVRFRDASKVIVLGAPVPMTLLGEVRELASLRLPEPDVPALPATREPSDAYDGPVAIGVIDDAIAFANARFCRRASHGLKSRVEWFWAMDAFPGGRRAQLTRKEIDGLLAAHTRSGLVDEDALYRAAGLEDFGRSGRKGTAWRLSHGSHVLDLAAGADPDEDVANRPILAVSLPSGVLSDTSGRFLEPFIALAIQQIRQRAKQLSGDGPRIPLVICISVGTIAGAHDGKSLLERLMDDIVVRDEGRTQFVLPAGNARQSRCHAVVPLEKKRTCRLTWKVLPDDRTESSVQIWMPPGFPKSGSSRVRIRLVDPSGAVSAWVDEAEDVGPVRFADRSGGCIAMLAYTYDKQRDPEPPKEPEDTPCNRGRFDIWLRPTMRFEPDPRPKAPAGRWTIEIAVTGDGAGDAHAWVQRDDSLLGRPQRGRQSYFDDPDYVRFDAYGGPVYDDPADPPGAEPGCRVSRESLLNPLACGKHVHVAGGYMRHDGRPAPYSATGPLTPPPHAGFDAPSVMMPSDASWVTEGVLATGSRSGSVVALDGTSVAAPQLARIVADHLARTVHGKPTTGQPLPFSRDGMQVFASQRDVFGKQITLPSSAATPAGRLARHDQRPVDRMVP